MKRPDFADFKLTNNLQHGFDEIGGNAVINDCEAYVEALEDEVERYRNTLADFHRASAEALDPQAVHV